MVLPTDGIPIIGGDDPTPKPIEAPNIGGVLSEKSRMTTPLPTGGYHPTLMYVACAKCKGIGEIEFPDGFDYKIGDKIMDKKVFKATCQRGLFPPYKGCKNELNEMVPIGIKQAMANLPALIYRHYRNLQTLIHRGFLVSKDDMEFGRVYEELYGIDGYPTGYDVPLSDHPIPDKLRDLLIRKGAAGA